MPGDSGLTFVVVLHLSPEFESSFSALLQKSTSVPVIQVSEPITIEANCVCVIRSQLLKCRPKPFPDGSLQREGRSAQRWICVESVVVDDRDALWVLDPASTKTEAVVKDPSW
jgi:hypothetical protein